MQISAGTLLSLLIRLKAGVVICWMGAVWINYYPDTSQIVSPLCFFACLLMFLGTRRFVRQNGRSLIVAIALACVAILYIDSLNASSNRLYAAWYAALIALLYHSSTTAYLRPNAVASVPHALRQAAEFFCIVILILSALSSYLFFSTSIGFLNPNVAAAICGALMLIYSLEAGCSAKQGRKQGRRSRPQVMMIAAATAASLQLSRSIVFWLAAWYFVHQFIRRERAPMAVTLTRGIFLAVLLFPLVIVAVPEAIDPDSLSDAVLNLPAFLRLKEGGLESDVLRLVHYPTILAQQILTRQELLFGLGFGSRPYLENLQPGEDLHNAFLVIIADGGIVLLIIISAVILRRGKSAPELMAARIVVFLSGVAFSGILVGFAPFTLTVTMFFVYASLIGRHTTYAPVATASHQYTSKSTPVDILAHD